MLSREHETSIGWQHLAVAAASNVPWRSLRCRRSRPEAPHHAHICRGGPADTRSSERGLRSWGMVLRVVHWAGNCCPWTPSPALQRRLARNVTHCVLALCVVTVSKRAFSWDCCLPGFVVQIQQDLLLGRACVAFDVRCGGRRRGGRRILKFSDGVQIETPVAPCSGQRAVRASKLSMGENVYQYGKNHETLVMELCSA